MGWLAQFVGVASSKGYLLIGKQRVIADMHLGNSPFLWNKLKFDNA